MPTQSTETMPEAWRPKTTLFALTDEILALDDMLTESMGELTPAIEAWMADQAERLADKTDRVAWYVRTCEAREAGYQKAADELTAKRNTERNKVTRIKEYVRACMERIGTKKLEGEVYTFAMQKNGGKPPVRLLTEDPQAFPMVCQKVVISVDKEAVREAIEHQELPEGLAVIEPPGEHLRLR